MIWPAKAQVGLAAIGTAALFVTLWLTWRAIKITENTAKQQLRAYVVVSDGQWALVDEGKKIIGNIKANISSRLKIKNAGQTPAHKVVAWTRTIIADRDERIDWNDRTGGYRRRFFLGPYEEATVHANGTFDADDYINLMKKNSIIYYYGEINYMDAFDTKRTTYFRFQWRNLAGGGTKFEICDEGNEAT